MEHVFEGCNIACVDMPFPDGSVGKCIVIQEKRPHGDTYRFPFGVDQARQLAEQLSSSVHVATPDQVEQILGRNGKKLH